MTLTVTLRGLTHGTGTNLHILRPSNLWVAPDLRVNDTEIPGSHGAVAGHDLYGPRRVPLTILLDTDGWREALEQKRAVEAAWAPSSEDLELRFSDGTGDYVMFGRPRQAAPDMTQAGAGKITFECRFFATDPFIYSATEYLAGTLAPTPPSGFTFPLVFDLVFGTPGTGGRMRIENAGNAPSARWRAAIIGPCSEPRISVGGQGVTYSQQLAAGELLELDGRARTALLQGSATVHVALSERRWFALDPGETEIQFSTADNQGALFFSWRDAWW